ncbi:hypothetical protein [Streptomyces chryseus]
MSGETHLYFTHNHAISDGRVTGAVLRALLGHLPDHPASGPDRDRAPGPCSGPASGTRCRQPFEDVHRLPPDADGLEYLPPSAPASAAPPWTADPAPVPFEATDRWADRAAGFTGLGPPGGATEATPPAPLASPWQRSAGSWTLCRTASDHSPMP